MSDYKGIRSDYQKGTLDITKVPEDPFEFFRQWMDEALISKVMEPTAMVLSTVSTSGRPSSRVVLLKEITDHGFRFFTNYDSQKGRELSQNPNASLVFFWPELERQIRISGVVKKTSKQVTLEYFKTRPLESQINAIISPQSQPINSREDLLTNQEKLKKGVENSGDHLPCPENWGGYEILPDNFEFWQGGPARLHSRIKYKLHENAWNKFLLAP